MKQTIQALLDKIEGWSLNDLMRLQDELEELIFKKEDEEFDKEYN